MLTHNMTGKSSALRCFCLGKQLVKRDHEVTIFTGRKERGWSVYKTVQEGVKIIEAPDPFGDRLRNSGLSPVQFFGRLAALLSRRKMFDIIHGFNHRINIFPLGFLLSRLQRLPYIADVSDRWDFQGISGLRYGLERAVLGSMDTLGEQLHFRAADGVTVANERLKDRAYQFGKHAEQIRLLQPGADIDTIKSFPSRSMRDKYGIDHDARVIVHSALSSYDEDLLADTFIALLKKEPSSLLLMTGYEFPQIQQKFRDAGVMNSVRHFGFVPYHELGEVLSCGDVCFFPFAPKNVNLGRGPNIFGDYLAAGRPIVTNPTGEVGETVAKYNLGIATGETPEECSNAILRFFKNEKSAEETGIRARNFAEEHYSWNQRAQALEKFYLSFTA
jgi:glycosyltransferase involved in cell wall biosynthesis